MHFTPLQHKIQFSNQNRSFKMQGSFKNNKTAYKSDEGFRSLMMEQKQEKRSLKMHNSVSGQLMQ